MSNSINGGKISVSKTFWLSIAGPLVVIAAVVGYLFIQAGDDAAGERSPAPSKSDGGSSYQDSVTEKWNAIQTVCAELVKKEQGVIDQGTLDAFSASVGVTSKRIAGSKKEIEAISPVPDEYRDKQVRLIASIASLEDYLAKLQAMTGKRAVDLRQEEFKPVDAAGVEAKKKTDLAVDEMGFLGRLPQVTFTLQTDLLTFYQSVWAGGQPPVQPAAPSRQPSQQPAPQSGLPAGAPGPNEAIDYFGSYFVSGDEYGMSQIMIGEAAGDFAAQSSGVYPFMHEILEGPSQQGGNYIYRVMYSFRVDTGPYLEDWTMVVSQQGSAYYITGVNLELRTEYTDN